MEAPSAQTITQYLYELAYSDTRLWECIKDEFLDFDHMQEEAFVVMGNELRGSYLMWQQYNDEAAALTHLQKVSAICNERLRPPYLLKYNTVVSYFKGTLSGSSTPVHVEQDNARMQNILLRMAAIARPLSLPPLGSLRAAQETGRLGPP